MWNLFQRPVKTWSVFDAASPITALVRLGSMPARTRREAIRRAREAWPGRDVAVEQLTAKQVAAIYAKARQELRVGGSNA